MACNCKKNVNPKYVDNEDELEQLGLGKLKGVEKIGNAILQFMFGLLASVIILIALVPAIIYMIFCMCTGKEMHIRIPNFTKWLKKEN